MNRDSRRLEVIAATNVQSYFHQSLNTALHNNHVNAEEETVGYLVRLLCNFMRSEQLFDAGEDGLRIKPLAFHYADAVHGTSRQDRHRALQRLGDVALFIAGLFADSLERKLVDIDYYIAMGGHAYGYLANNEHRAVLIQVFSELSEKFVSFVDVLAEIGDQSHMQRDANIMRLYEIWLKTGSARAARRLRAVGIEPNAAASPRVRH